MLRVARRWAARAPVDAPDRSERACVRHDQKGILGGGRVGAGPVVGTYRKRLQGRSDEAGGPAHIWISFGIHRTWQPPQRFV